MTSTRTPASAPDAAARVTVPRLPLDAPAPPGVVRRALAAVGPGGLSREAAAARVSAYVYGNILVIAALISLTPAGVRTTSALLSVLGVGLTTFVAHAVSQAVALRIRVGRTLTTTDVVAEVRDGMPIVTSAVVATLAVAGAGLAGLSSGATLLAALAVPAGRLALLGSVVEHLQGRSSRRVIGAGVGLAVVGIAVAVLKLVVAH
jgi:hypothetical protein